MLWRFATIYEVPSKLSPGLQFLSQYFTEISPANECLQKEVFIAFPYALNTSQILAYKVFELTDLMFIE